MAIANYIKLDKAKTTFNERKLVEFFENNKGKHFTARELFQEISQSDYSVSSPSIYRLLKVLETKKQIQRLATHDGASVYEMTDGKRHDHLICSRCSKTVPLYEKRIDSFLDSIAEENNTKIENRNLVIYVSCLGKNCSIDKSL